MFEQVKTTTKTLLFPFPHLIRMERDHDSLKNQYVERQVYAMQVRNQVQISDAVHDTAHACMQEAARRTLRVRGGRVLRFSVLPIYLQHENLLRVNHHSQPR